MTLYSQRDPKWSANKLGFSTNTTLGSHGCTLTALAQLLTLNNHNYTPAMVNEALKSVNGFAGANRNLIIWSAIEKALPAKHITRAYSYNNDAVASAISKYGGCLVEVDATRIGAPTHWVLYIGNQRMIDPWTGVEKATNYYPPKGYSIIEVNKGAGNPPSMQDDLKILLSYYNVKSAQELIDMVDKELEFLENEREKTRRLQADLDGANAKADQRKKEYENLLETLAKKLALPTTSDISDIMGAIERLLAVEDQLAETTKKLSKEQEKHESEKNQMKSEMDRLREAIEKQQKENETLLARVDDLEKRLEAREQAIEASNRFSKWIESLLRLLKG